MKVILLWALASLIGQGPTVSVTTMLDANLDLPAKAYPKDNQGPHDTTNGFCLGGNAFVHASLQARLAQKNFAGFTQLSSNILNRPDGRGDAYLHDVLMTGQLVAAKNRVIPDYGEGVRDPNGFTDAVVARMRADHMPVSVGLSQKGGTHEVSLYGADKTANVWAFKVADINHVQGDAGAVLMFFNSVNHTWVETVNGKTTEVWNGVGIDKAAARNSAVFEKMLDMVRQGKSIRAIQDESLHQLPALEQQQIEKHTSIIQKVRAVGDKILEIGGVSVQYDPDLFTGAVNPEKLKEMSRKTEEFMAGTDAGALILRPEPRELSLVVIPLSQIKPEGSLGGLTRVRGFVQHADGTISIVGNREAGRFQIPAEYLAFALQSIYRDGMKPYISLDGDPVNAAGPQHVRIGQVAQDLRSTAFIKALIDADYLMKRINLGREDTGIEGFTPVVRSTEHLPSYRGRAWFTPMPLPLGDAYSYRAGGAMAVYFESQTRVLSEQEKLAEGGLSAEADTVLQQAAASFTYHFDAMAAKYIDFQRLSGAFDVCKFSIALRNLKVQSANLEPFLKYRPPVVAIPAAYPGIGPEMSPDHMSVIAGGAVADPTFRTKGVVATASLAPLLSAEGAVKVTLPAALRISDETLAAFTAESEIAEASRELYAGLHDEALRHVEPMLKLDPDDARALLLHALCMTAAGKSREALADYDRLVVTSPMALGLRAAIRADLGDIPGALADASKVEELFGDQEAALVGAIGARLIALDFAGASTDLARLRRVSPNYPLTATLENQIYLYRTLGVQRARERLRLTRDVPLEIQVAVAPGPGQTVERMRNALTSLENERLKTPEALYVPDRLRIGIALKMMKSSGDPANLNDAMAGVQKVIAAHPDWASGYLGRAVLLYALSEPIEKVAEALRTCSKLEVNADPVMADIQTALRVVKVTPSIALLMLMDTKTDAASLPELEKLIVEMEPPGAGRTFSERLFQPENTSLLLNLKSPRNWDLKDSDRGTWARLAQITTGLEHIQGDDPMYLIALSLCAVPTSLAVSGRPEYDQLMTRGLSLAARTDVPRFLDGLAAQTRAAQWAAKAFSVPRLLLAKDSPLLKSADVFSAELDRLSGPDSAPDSREKVIASLRRCASQVIEFHKALLTETGRILSEVRKKSGDATYFRVEFSLSTLQLMSAHSPDNNIKRLIERHTFLKGRPEVTELRQALLPMEQLFLEASPKKLWTSVLESIRTRNDGLSVFELLKQLSGMTPASMKVEMDSFAAQARAQTDLYSADISPAP